MGVSGDRLTGGMGRDEFAEGGRRRGFGPLRAAIMSLFFMVPLVGLGLGETGGPPMDDYRPKADRGGPVIFAGDSTTDSLIITKLTVPPQDSTLDAASFVFTGDASGSIQDRQRIIVGPLPPGDYTVTEDATPDWTLTSILCSATASGDVDTATASMTIFGDGSNASCIFTNVQDGLVFHDGFELGDSSAWSMTSPKPPGLCAHSLCTEGEALAYGCNSCVTEICSVDAFCCNGAWDTRCVWEVTTVCGIPCG